MSENIDFLFEPDDRRHHPRFRSTAFSGIPIRLKPLPPYFGDTLPGTLVDLSAGGMAIRIDEVIPEKTKLDMELIFPDRTVLKSKVNICRTAKKNKEYLIGIEFMGLPEFMKEKINKMSFDFLACEKRIKDKAAEICLAQCTFFNICDKPQKATLLKKMEVHLKLNLKKPE